MNLISYQEQSSRTCPFLGSPIVDSIHMTVGIMTEVKEMFECIKTLNDKEFDAVNLAEELADMMWYLSNYCRLREIEEYKALDFQKTFYWSHIYEEKANVKPFDLILYHAGDLLDYDKKELAYKKQYKQEFRITSVRNLFYAISDTFLYFELDPYQALDNNIDKLRVRFPDKFTEELAQNRNLEAERKELEK
jgi:uncharacterized protein YabN with tetrapyrrole methylase and pyrophosphatase domain